MVEDVQPQLLVAGHPDVGELTKDRLPAAALGHDLEFTRKAGHPAGKAPTEDNLLVFYLPDRDEWLRAVARLEGEGYGSVEAFNPYWDRAGKTFADPDGYRVVLQNAVWPNS